MQKKPIRLEELERKEILFAPEGYFDTLPSAIQKRISQPTAVKYGFSTGWIRYTVGLSMLALLVTTGYWFYQKPADPHLSQVAISQLSATEIVEYLKQSSVSQEDLVDLATKENIEVQNLLLRETDEQKLLEEIDHTLIEEPM